MRAILLLLMLFALGQIAGAFDPRFAPVGAALADDDDDGGSDDDDDDGPGGRQNDNDDDGPRRSTRPNRQQGGRPVAPPPVPPPAYRAEIVVQGLAATDLARLLSLGFQVIETQELPARGGTLRRLAAPEGLDLTAARDLVRALPSGAGADFNHFYRGGQASGCTGPHCPAFAQVGWQSAPALACAPAQVVRVGMIDTGINAAHESLQNADLVLHRLQGGTGAPSTAQHGTAVAALLIGGAESRTPGLIPDLPLIAVDTFERAGSDERADVFALIRGLALLQASDVRVINLSLAGPENTALSQSLSALAEAGIVLVAAGGNGGPRAAPLWPAAHPQVIAVTAVDRTGAVYRRAGQGAHIALAAPGVEVWTAASVSGGRSKTGTSFAAPFVTAAAARLLQSMPDLSATEVSEHLFQSAEDLGAPGYDPVFGHGLIRLPPPC